jgi:hypothetical protein
VLKAKRLAVWAVELVVQASLLIVLVFQLSHPYGHTTFREVISAVLAILLYFCITGYAITTIFSRLFWDQPGLWTYPAFAAALFFIHFEILNGLAGGHLLNAHLRTVFVICGMGIAFITTSIGALLLTGRRAHYLGKT